MIQWDKKLLCDALTAKEDHACDANSGSCVLSFSDKQLHYALTIFTDNQSAFFAADPQAPNQAMPMLEVTFRCERIEIRRTAYGDSLRNAVCFFEKATCDQSLWLTLKPTASGNRYIWANGST